MNFGTITFHGKEYPTFEVEVNGNMELCATDRLGKLLMNDNYEYVDDEARQVDGEITYYVEDKDLELSDSELSALVVDAIA